jgi:formate dehydrogenase subunit gamma
MSIRLRDSGELIQIRWIPKYTLLERIGHWVHAGTYIPLAITGLLLFMPGVKGLTQGALGENLRFVHRILAVLFLIPPVLYLLLQPHRLAMHFREVFQFSRDDIGWLKAAGAYYLLGRHVDMPPQPRFNTGERLNAAVIMVGTVVFAITGLLMWFGKGIVPPAVFQISVIVHDLAMVATLCMFIIHFYLAVAHPLMWQAMVSMRFGVISESYAREHHAKWFYGPTRAKALWEKRREEEKEAKTSEA